MLASEESVSTREKTNTDQRVLNYSHAVLVGLRSHYLIANMHNVFDLGLGLVSLGHMHVHLVSIEVRVVGCRH